MGDMFAVPLHESIVRLMTAKTSLENAGHAGTKVVGPLLKEFMEARKGVENAYMRFNVATGEKPPLVVADCGGAILVASFDEAGHCLFVEKALQARPRMEQEI